MDTEEVGNLEEKAIAIFSIAEASLELAQDFSYCSNALKKDIQSQFWRRTMVRTLFASTELLTHAVRQNLMYYSQAGIIELSLPELTILEEKSYGLKNNGKISVQKMKLRTADNFRFSLSLFHERMATGYLLDFGGNGWQSFLESLKIRDRITHPKNLDEITVLDDELEILSNAMLLVSENHMIIARTMEEVAESSLT